jgi:hypothetical protein
VLNDPTNMEAWKGLVKEDYGKFSSLPYPYQIWEPDSQADLLAYADLFLGGPPHPPGLHFAINMDINQFRVHTASRTGNGWNVLLDDQARAPLPLVIGGEGDGTTPR